MPRRLGRFRPIPASPKAASRRRASRRSPDPPPVPPARLTLRPLVYQVEELTKQNEQLILALDAANRQVAELGASLETGGDRLAAGVRESKIVDVSKKNRVLRLELEREKAEKARLGAQLKALKARLGEPNEKRTESQVEAACREVVEEASKNAESATKECAEWREKWKQASARAERFSGQKAYIKTENDRLKTIIKREIGDDVDFGKLDDEIAATGGWRGRARRIRDLAAERDFLKTQLADANDALAAIAEEPEADGAGDKPRRETPLEATRRELEETRLRLAKARDDAERQRERRRAAGADLAAADRERESLAEKTDALKQKSDHDEKLIEALRAEVRRANAKAKAAGGVDDARLAGKSVPAAAYKAMEARCVAQEEKLREQDREMAALRRGGVASCGRDTTSAAAIAAAAAGDDGAGDGGLGPSPAPSVSALSEQHEEDVANLVRHAETLEGVCEKLRGNLAASEKRVDALREQVMLERRKFRNLLARIEHRGGEDEAAAAAAVEASEAELAALRRALEEQKEETERVRAKYKDQMEEMEHEVELYVEMVDEMKRELGAR